MPIFRYHCNKCQADFELLLARFDSEAECPACGSEDLEKAPNLIGGIHSASKSSCAMSSVCPSASGGRYRGCEPKATRAESGDVE